MIWEDALLLGGGGGGRQEGLGILPDSSDLDHI